MWISNTPAVVIVLPVAMLVVAAAEEARVDDADTKRFALSMTLVELTVWLLALLLVVR